MATGELGGDGGLFLTAERLSDGTTGRVGDESVDMGDAGVIAGLSLSTGAAGDDSFFAGTTAAIGRGDGAGVDFSGSAEGAGFGMALDDT